MTEATTPAAQAPETSAAPATEQVQAVRTWVKDSREELSSFVSELVRIPSVSGNEGECSALLADRLRACGFDVEQHLVPAEHLDRWPEFAHETDLERRPSIIARLSAAAPDAPTIVLNGHVDVVPPGDRAAWSDDPFSGTRNGGRIHGRGTADMKGGIASAVFAMLALKDVGVGLPFHVELQCVVAEETGGLGTLSLMSGRPSPAGAIVLEPTSCRPVPACGGAAPFTIRVSGSAAHVGAPWTGVDALDKALLVRERLQRLESRRSDRLSHRLFDELPRKAALSIGQLTAGEWRLTIPGSATIHGRIGTLPQERLQDVRSEVEETLAELAVDDSWLAQHRPQLGWDGPGFPGWETPEHDPLVRAISTAATALGGDPTPAGATYGSDAGVFASLGVPVVLFGPGDLVEAHAKDESVGESEVSYVTAAVAEGLLNLSAHHASTRESE